YQAKTHLPALLKRVEAGESLTITRHGRPIARLVPVAELRRISAADAAEGLRRLRKRTKLGPDLSVRDIIEAGRR
ncbi:MAG: type II toxin-antitoxin system prevent-host-death family antitoxin, partial [Deltaproteobacteria bacterium]|nr:type II toxin-antitoxin system prevent-host-death family antitoxin [Deltaproteobacteria bacterium]